MKKRFLALCALACALGWGGTLLAQTDPPSRPKEDDRRPGRPPRGSGGPPPLTPEEREKFRVRLGITTQQQEQMETLFQETHKKRTELWKRMGELFEERNKVCNVYDFDRGKERSIRAQLNKINSQMLAIHVETEEKLRVILNKEQFDRLRVVRDEMWQNRPHRPRGDKKERPEPPSP